VADDATGSAPDEAAIFIGAERGSAQRRRGKAGRDDESDDASVHCDLLECDLDFPKAVDSRLSAHVATICRSSLAQGRPAR
jgi:hypothetical protein